MASTTPPGLLTLLNQPFTSPCLWLGGLEGVVDPHSDQQLARGFLPYWRKRGSCEVRGGLASLWYAAAKELGFRIATICCPDSLLVCQVASLWEGVKSLALLLGRLRCPHCLPDIVFTDLTSVLLGPNSVKYWRVWQTPHLFYCLGVDNSLSPVGAVASLGTSSAALSARLTVATPTPLLGWTAHSVCLSHRETGGLTSSHWTFVMWYPPGFPWVKPLV
jgi:hypothetical protein